MEKLKNPINYQDKMSANPDTLGHNLSANVNYIKDLTGLTLPEIADGAGLTIEAVKAVIYYENKDYKITTAARLASFFGLSIDELVGAGTISPETIKSLRTLRKLDHSYRDFFRWFIQYVYTFVNRTKVRHKAVPIMHPRCNAETGSLAFRLRDVSGVIDISDLQEDLRFKIMAGIEVPCSHYMPQFMQGDVLLIANDRASLPHEVCVIESAGCLWFCKRIVEGGRSALHALTDEAFICYADEADQVVGYVAAVRSDLS